MSKRPGSGDGGGGGRRPKRSRTDGGYSLAEALEAAAPAPVAGGSLAGLETYSLSEHAGPGAVRELARALVGNRTLKQLAINNRRLNDEDARELASALDGNRDLETLDLSGCVVQDEVPGYLARLLQRDNARIHELDMSRCTLFGDQMAVLMEGLKSNHWLRILRLNDNPGNTVGVVAEVLLRNAAPRLQHIHAADTVREDAWVGGDDHCNACGTMHDLADALSFNRSVLTLDISGQMGCDHCVCTVAKGLHKNVTLWSLTMGGVDLGMAGGLAIFTLTSVNLVLDRIEGATSTRGSVQAFLTPAAHQLQDRKRLRALHRQRVEQVAGEVARRCEENAGGSMPNLFVPFLWQQARAFAAPFSARGDH